MNNKFLKNLILTSIVTPPIVVPPIVQSEHFTIYRTGTQSSTTITLKKTGSPVVSGLYYRYINNDNWLPLADSSGNLSTLTLNSTNGYVVQFYNTNDTFSTDSSNYLQFSFSGGNVGCNGNIQSLMNFSNECKPYCYYNIFRDCTSLTESPSILPAITLDNSCYQAMFYNCKSLIEAPELPATTLADSCYSHIFYNCKSLIEAPELPATTLADSCYQSMFNSCASLTKAPELPATKLKGRCYLRMFAGCTSLTKAPELPATTLANSCYHYMFEGCTSLKESPSILPATKLTEYCYAYMFKGCTRLTAAPELPATNLVSWCYEYMFYNCKSLIEAPELPATTLTNGCYAYMFAGCTRLTAAPELPATRLDYRCYAYMFQNCTSLNYIKVGFTSWNSSGSSSTDNWVSGVSSSGSFEAPSSLPLEFGASRIPAYWSFPGHGNIIFVNDQACFSMPNQEFSYTIQYMLYPETLKPTFKITSGTLPDGVTLDENTGVVSGLIVHEMTTNLQVTLSCSGCEDKVINFTISITTTKWTENNLTSNTSNSAYEVSQRSTNGSYHAWYAMDGNATSYSKTQYASGQYDWWMIDFKGPVLLNAVELTCNNEVSYGTYLEGSNDKFTWTRLDTTKFPDNATTLREYSLTTAYRYYRLISERQWNYIQFYEVRFKYSPSN